MFYDNRIQVLKRGESVQGSYVLYWMQQSQRTRFNHALEFAVLKANTLKLPLVTCFVLTDKFPEANLRHYTFMLEGLREVISDLNKRNIGFVLRIGDMVENVVKLAGKAALLITDYGYLRIQRVWRKNVAKLTPCPVYAIESDVIVPVGIVSSKEEYAARTIRSRINKQLDNHLEVVEEYLPVVPANGLDIKGHRYSNWQDIVKELEIDTNVSHVSHFRGGYSEAYKRLTNFIRRDLPRYHDFSNDPAQPCLSNLSPYLHFGQISPLEIAIEIMHAEGPEESKADFLEQLIIRRELSMNFIYYNKSYDVYQEAIPEWALKTLDNHRGDQHPYLYSRAELENARTHDKYWNAMQIEMIVSGKMHGYLRMYWGKKVIEWSPSPEEAFDTLIFLNNKYELDGRDPNGFTGIAWCFGKHDHPWQERPVFGKVRYMNARGLERKFNMEAYLQRINELL